MCQHLRQHAVDRGVLSQLRRQFLTDPADDVGAVELLNLIEGQQRHRMRIGDGERGTYKAGAAPALDGVKVDDDLAHSRRSACRFTTARTLRSAL